MKNFSYELIGTLKSLSQDFVAFDGCLLYAVSYWSTEELKTVRFVTFVPNDALSYFELLTPDAKKRALLRNELSKDDLSLMLCEYNILPSRKYKI